MHYAILFNIFCNTSSTDEVFYPLHICLHQNLSYPVVQNLKAVSFIQTLPTSINCMPLNYQQPTMHRVLPRRSDVINSHVHHKFMARLITTRKLHVKPEDRFKGSYCYQNFVYMFRLYRIFHERHGVSWHCMAAKAVLDKLNCRFCVQKRFTCGIWSASAFVSSVRQRL